MIQLGCKVNVPIELDSLFMGFVCRQKEKYAHQLIIIVLLGVTRHFENLQKWVNNVSFDILFILEFKNSPCSYLIRFCQICLSSCFCLKKCLWEIRNGVILVGTIWRSWSDLNFSFRYCSFCIMLSCGQYSRSILKQVIPIIMY